MFFGVIDIGVEFVVFCVYFLYVDFYVCCCDESVVSKIGLFGSDCVIDRGWIFVDGFICRKCIEEGFEIFFSVYKYMLLCDFRNRI